MPLYIRNNIKQILLYAKISLRLILLKYSFILSKNELIIWQLAGNLF